MASRPMRVAAAKALCESMKSGSRVARRYSEHVEDLLIEGVRTTEGVELVVELATRTAYRAFMGRWTGWAGAIRSSKATRKVSTKPRPLHSNQVSIVPPPRGRAPAT